MCSSTRPSLKASLVFQMCLTCLVLCVHHSHQADNLSKDVAKTWTRQSAQAKLNTPDILLRAKRSDHDHDEDDHHDLHCGHGYRVGHNETGHVFCARIAQDPTVVWLSAIGAVLIISLCGIFGVLVIPIMQKVFYQHLIQFLVALAVGTMAGDALLHLLPHALVMGFDMPHEMAEAFENQAVWKLFFALMSFVSFFLLERLINIVGEWRERKKRSQRERKVRVVRSGHRTSDKAVGEKACKHKYSSYCVSDIDVVTNSAKKSNETTPLNPAHLVDAEKTNQEDVEGVTRENGRPESTKMTSTTLDKLDNTYDTVFLREHENVHHGHSHAHSHLHSKPDSISSVGKNLNPEKS